VLLAYNPTILEHFNFPQNVGCLNSKAMEIGTGVAGTRTSGDVIQLQVKISEQQIIVDTKFKAQAAVTIVAACSWITAWLQGKSLLAVAQLQSNDIVAALNLPPVKIHSALLVMDAVKAAITDWQGKNIPKAFHF
jgi:NifU-like protein involved in Fe-S cluster formation